MAQGEGNDHNDPEQDDEAADQVTGGDCLSFGDFTIPICKLVELAQDLVAMNTNRIEGGMLVGRHTESIDGWHYLIKG